MVTSCLKPRIVTFGRTNLRCTQILLTNKASKKLWSLVTLTWVIVTWIQPMADSSSKRWQLLTWWVFLNKKQFSFWFSRLGVNANATFCLDCFYPTSFGWLLISSGPISTLFQKTDWSTIHIRTKVSTSILTFQIQPKFKQALEKPFAWWWWRVASTSCCRSSQSCISFEPSICKLLGLLLTFCQ